MPVDLCLVIEFVGFLASIALIAYGIAKLDIRLTAAGGAVVGLVWLLAAWSNEDQEAYEKLDYLVLQLQLVDETTAETISDERIQVEIPDETGQRAAYRLPTTIERSADDRASEVITVSLFLKRRIRGSLIEQYRDPAICTELVDQNLKIVAPGYRSWHGRLKQLLSDVRPGTKAAEPIVIELRRK